MFCFVFQTNIKIMVLKRPESANPNRCTPLFRKGRMVPNCGFGGGSCAWLLERAPIAAQMARQAWNRWFWEGSLEPSLWQFLGSRIGSRNMLLLYCVILWCGSVSVYLVCACLCLFGSCMKCSSLVSLVIKRVRFYHMVRHDILHNVTPGEPSEEES